MAHRFRLVPVEPEVPSCDRQIRRDSQLFALANGQQSAIVANPQPHAAKSAAPRTPACPLPNFVDQSQFATAGSKMGLFHTHLMRIGQVGRFSTG